MSPRVRRIFLKILPRLLRLNRPDPRERSSLNRFRKKKIAQQLLKASSANKVYDLAQPLAASLNLIETLHKSYDSNARKDGIASLGADDDSDGAIMKPDDDDQGRYFRRYVDDYISRLKQHQESDVGIRTNANGGGKPACGCNCTGRQVAATKTSSGCCEQNRCCSLANQPLQHHHFNLSQMHNASQTSQRSARGGSCCSRATKADDPSLIGTNSANNKRTTRLDGSPCFNCGSINRSSMSAARCSSQIHNKQSCCAKRASFGCTGQHAGMLNDDTLDLTFDYDDQDANINTNNAGGFVHSASQSMGTGKLIGADDLPSPPPPPRQLAQLTDSISHQNKSGRVSSCSKNNLSLNDGSDALEGAASGGHDHSNRGDVDECQDDDDELMDHGRLVDKLINSINLINNASDEMDTTTTASNEHELMLDQDYSRLLIDQPSSTIHQQQQQQPLKSSAHFEHHGPSPLVLARGGGYVDEDEDNADINNFLDSSVKSSATDANENTRNMGIGMDDNQCCQLPQLRQRGGPNLTKVNNSRLFDQLHHSNIGCSDNNASGDERSRCVCNQPLQDKMHQAANDVDHHHPHDQNQQQQQANRSTNADANSRNPLTSPDVRQPSDLLLSLRLSYDKMPAHVRAAIRSILFIADTIKNEDDENSAIEDWESMSMVVDRLFLWIFFLLCTFGSIIILALAPSLYDQRASIDDKLRIDIPPSNCSLRVYAGQ